TTTESNSRPLASCGLTRLIEESSSPRSALLHTTWLAANACSRSARQLGGQTSPTNRPAAAWALATSPGRPARPAGSRWPTVTGSTTPTPTRTAPPTTPRTPPTLTTRPPETKRTTLVCRPGLVRRLGGVPRSGAASIAGSYLGADPCSHRHDLIVLLADLVGPRSSGVRAGP